MLTCPLCKKTFQTPVRECPSCRTDLSLLADFVTYLQEGLTRANALTRAGELGNATWAYLAVLEVDPENAHARKQVGLVATAVRQFDKSAPGRRWGHPPAERAKWRWLAIGVLLSLLAFIVGYLTGRIA